MRRERRRTAAFDGFEPYGNFGEQRSYLDSPKAPGALLKPALRASQQRDSSGAVPRCEMMECGCDLNQGLQEAFLRFIEREPDAFPVFVSIEVFATPIACEALGEPAAVPVKKHRFRITGDAARFAAISL